MTIPPWRATCLQFESKLAAPAQGRDAAWEVIRGNIAVGVAAVRAACASAEPPRLVVMPEFVFTGPPRTTPVADWIERACAPIPGPITEVFADLAREYGIYIAGNHFEVDPRWPDRYFNSSFLLDPKGEVILRYRRINTASWTSPHDILDEYLAAYGDEGIFPVADTELGRLAIFPCGEVSVPEIARMFALRGAEVLLHPNNEPMQPGPDGIALSDAAKLCRAAENMCYLISANVAGTAGFSDTLQGGHSQIVDFRGQRVAFRQEAGAGSCSALIDIGALQAARADTGMGNGLMRTRLEMYRDAYAGTVYPANGLPRAVQGMADFAPLHEAALGNMRRQGILR